MNSQSHKHINIYADTGHSASALGYVFQQSNSFDMQWFVKNTKGYDAGMQIPTFEDPWDARPKAYNQNSLKQEYVNIIESSQNPWTTGDLDDYIKKFPMRTIFGMNHGVYKKQVPWKNEQVQCVYVCNNSTVLSAFYNMYGQRRIASLHEVMSCVNDHLHDHKRDSTISRKIMQNDILPKANQWLKNGTPIYFWQFMYYFHIPNPALRYFPHCDEKKETFDTHYIGFGENSCRVEDDMDEYYVQFNDPFMITDPLDLNIKNVCKKLDIVYNERIGREYDKWRAWINKYAQM